jgi:hypothetical protein
VESFDASWCRRQLASPPSFMIPKTSARLSRPKSSGSWLSGNVRLCLTLSRYASSSGCGVMSWQTAWMSPDRTNSSMARVIASTPGSGTITRSVDQK